MLKWQSTLKTSSDPFYSFWWIGEKTFLGVFARLVKERAAGQFCAENILLVDNSPRLWEPITRLQRISPHHWTDNLLKWIFYVQAPQFKRRINIDNLGLFWTQLDHFRRGSMAKKHFVFGGALVQIVQISWDLGQHLDVNNLKMIKEKKIRKTYKLINRQL